MVRLRILLVAVLTFSIPGVAMASPSFPGVIRNTLDLDYQPPCTLCHASVSGGGPVVTVFGQSLLARGLKAGSDSSLTTALNRLVADGVDSDNAGVVDVDELLSNSDPNSADTTTLVNNPPVEYGCVGQIAPGRDLRWSTLFGALVLGLLWARRRRNAGNESSSKP